MSEIDTNIAMRAFQGVSFHPDERGRRVIEDFKNETDQDYQELLKHAPTDEKKAILDEEFARYRGGYAARQNKWLAAEGRCLSSMITGPSNFPTARNQKRNDISHRRLTEAMDYRKWALNEIKKKLHPEWRPIMAGDDDAQKRLKEKIEKAEERQEFMKKINGIIRKSAKGGGDAIKLALAKEGISADWVAVILKPNTWGNIGFERYELTNNNANLKRMKGRLEQITRNQAKEDVKVEGTNARLEDCAADNRVRLFFPGKPSEEIRTRLKKAGFRWSPTVGAWQAYRNQWAFDLAKEIAGVENGKGKN